MRLPKADRASVPLHKLVDYCLNPAHEAGSHKARLFRAALGLTRSDALTLQSALLDAARGSDAEWYKRGIGGDLYVVRFEMTHLGRTATVLSGWFVDDEDGVPRLTTCYPDRKRD